MTSLKVKISLFLNYFIFAILLNTVGIVISQVLEEYSISTVAAGSLEAFKDLSIMVMSFAVASYIPKFGYRRAMLSGLLAVTIACTMIASIRQYWVTPLLYMVTGASFALMKVSVYSTIGLITKNPQEHAGFMNLIEGTFMVGFLTGPLIFSVMISVARWNYTYFVLAGLSAIAFILLLFTQLDESAIDEKAKNSNLIEMFSLMKYPMVWVFIICAFLYVMIEQSFGTWLPTFNRKIFSLSQAQSASFLSIYAGSIALSRFLAGFLYKKISWLKIQLIYLLCAALLTLAVLIQTLGWTAPAPEQWFDAHPLAFIFSLIGFFIGPIYPTIISIVLSRLEKIHHASMSGLIIIFSALGGTSGSFLIGLFSTNFDIHTAFYFTFIPITLISFMLIPYKKLTDQFAKEHHTA